MDVLKKKRTVYRADFTRVLNQLHKLLRDERIDQVDKNATFKLLEEKLKLLKEIDDQILENLISDGVEVDTFLEDRSISDDYTIQFNKISELIKVEKDALNNQRTSSMRIPSSSEQSNELQKSSSSTIKNVSSNHSDGNFIQALEITGNKYINSTITMTQYQSTLKPRPVDGLMYNIPGNPDHEIIGREHDANQVYKLLINDNVFKNRVVITGAGGIGKTTFAVYCVKKWKFDTVAFLHAEDYSTFENTVKGFAINLNIDKSLSNSDIFKKVAEIYKGKKLLLVLDNLEKLQVVKDVLDLPSNIYILGTSQNREFGTKFQEHRLKVLSKTNSEVLIISIFGPDFSLLSRNAELNNEIENLITKLDGFPLSLAQVASLIKVEVDNLCNYGDVSRSSELYRKTIKNYLNDFDKRIEDTIPDQFVTIDSKSTFTALKMNIEKAINFTHATVQVLAIISNLKPYEIKKNMFYILFGEDEANIAVTHLKKFSIITDERENLNEIYLDIHSITQNVARVVLNKIIWKDKFALYSLLFDQNVVCSFNETDMLKTIKIVDSYSIRSSLEGIIERAYLFLKKNVNNSIDILEKAGCSAKKYSEWPLSHKLLLASDANFNSKLMIDVMKEIEKKEQLTIINNSGLTTLHLIVTKTIEEAIIIFLKRKFSDDQVLSHNVTPLHIAIEFSSSENCFFYDMDAWKLLINKSAINETNNNGDTILHKISKKGLFFNSGRFRQDLIEILFKNGAKLDIKNKNGDAPIHLATRENNAILIYLFHDLGKEISADLINLKNDNGNTALHIAIEPLNCLHRLKKTEPHLSNSNHVTKVPMEISDYLIGLFNTIKIKCNARTDIPNKNGETVVDIANKNGQTKLGEWLKKSDEELKSMNLIWHENEFTYV